MPIEYRIDQEHSLVRFEVSDPLEPAQIAGTVQRLLADPELRPGLRILSDHTNLDTPATTKMVKTLPAFLEQLGNNLGRFRCALVVSTTVSYGMGRMAEAYAEDGLAEVRVFRSLDEAEAWLGVSANAPDATDSA